jgi:hypothetical protein
VEFDLPVALRREALSRNPLRPSFFQIYPNGAADPIKPDTVVIADLTNWTAQLDGHSLSVDPELGRILFPGSQNEPSQVQVTYSYAFSDALFLDGVLSAIGGGPYDRTGIAEVADFLVDSGTTNKTLSDALIEWGALRPATIQIQDNATYPMPEQSAPKPTYKQIQVRAYQLYVERRYSTFFRDFVGQSGAPAPPDRGMLLQDNLTLTKGACYAEGLLVENETDIDLKAQLLEQPKDGLYLIYLDVWTGNISAAEDKDLPDPALGGPDTTTRMRTEWKILYQWLADNNAAIQPFSERYYQSWPTGQAVQWDWERGLSSGTMSVDKANVTGNRLYRVEVHQEGDGTAATVKWSRDNAYVVAPASLDTDNVTLKLPDPRMSEAFRGALYVEVSGDTNLRNGTAGTMAKLSQAPVQASFLLVEQWLPKAPAAANVQTVRRWDLEYGPIQVADTMTLGQELTVSFDTTPAAYYRAGDYWLVLVRDGNIVRWDTDSSGNLVARAPDGVVRSFAALALVHKQGSAISLADKLQSIFQPLTTGNVSKSGDTINGNLCVRGELGIGACNYLAPLSVSVALDGSLASFEDQSGADAWRISHIEQPAQLPALNITDSNGNGLTIQRWGNIGIGTTNPQSSLEISGSLRATSCSQATSFPTSGRGLELFYGLNGGNVLAYDRSTSALLPLTIVANPTSFMRGNVGVGTPNPSYPLTVWSDKVPFPGIAFFQDGGVQNGDPNTYLWVSNNNDPGQHYWGFKAESSGDWALHQGNAGDRIHVSGATGNVGIGTSSPYSQLHIFSTTSPTSLRIQSAPGAFGAGKLEFWSDPQGSATEWRPGFIQSVDAGGFTGGLAFFTNGTGPDHKTDDENEAMRIINGHVGIGTSAPQTKLDVNGDITLRGGLVMTKRTVISDPSGYSIHEYSIRASLDGSNGAVALQCRDDYHHYDQSGTEPGTDYPPLKLQPEGGNVIIGGSGKVIVPNLPLLLADPNTQPVYVDPNGVLGKPASAHRFKEDIRNMDDASSLMRLRPVTFRYRKPSADGSKPIQYGLIAEEVAEVYPNLVTRSSEGEVESVMYHSLTPMLLNEVQRLDRENQDLRTRLAGLEEALAKVAGDRQR